MFFVPYQCVYPRDGRERGGRLLLCQVQPIPYCIRAEPQRFGRAIWHGRRVRRAITAEGGPLLPIAASIICPFNGGGEVTPHRVLF